MIFHSEFSLKDYPGVQFILCLVLLLISKKPKRHMWYAYHYFARVVLLFVPVKTAKLWVVWVNIPLTYSSETPTNLKKIQMPIIDPCAN